MRRNKRESKGENAKRLLPLNRAAKRFYKMSLTLIPEMKTLNPTHAEFLRAYDMSDAAFTELVKTEPVKARFLLSAYRTSNVADYGDDWSGLEFVSKAITEIEKMMVTAEAVKAEIVEPVTAEESETMEDETPASFVFPIAEEIITEAEEIISKKETAPFIPIDAEVMADGEEIPRHEKEKSGPRIVTALDSIIGQAIGVERLKSAVLAAIEGREVSNYLIKGEAGLGKTALANALLADIGNFSPWETIRISDPDEVRIKNDNWSALLDAITDTSRRVLVYIDECHKLNTGGTVQIRKLRSLIMKFADGNNTGSYIQIDDDTALHVDRSRLAFVLSTNFPDKLDTSGAFQSRFSHIELDHYNISELVSILQVMLKKAGFRAADETTLSLVAKCGRGTARPMEKLVEELRSFVTKDTINKDDVKSALRRCKLYPDGFNQPEIELLTRISQPMKDNVLLSAFPNMETTTLRRAKGHMMALGYANQITGGFHRTDKGSAYLKACAAQGFAV